MLYKQTKTNFMQKTITLKNLKKAMLKSFLTILVLGISFQVSFAQKQTPALTNSMGNTSTPIQAPAVKAGEGKGSKFVNVTNPKANTISPIKMSANAAPLKSQPVSIVPPQVNKDLLVGKEALVANDNAATDVPSLNNKAANIVKSNI